MKPNRTLKTLLLIIFTGLFSLTGVGQNQDIIRNIAKQLQSGQITQQEAIQRAREAGASQSQIEQARQRYQDTSRVEVSDLDRSAAPGRQQERDSEQEEEPERDEEPETEARDTARYFGYELFDGARDKYERADIGGLDPGYQIGPGDELILSIWGATEMRNKYQVSREGTIFVERYGQMVVGGLSLQQLEDKLTKNLSRIYSGLSPRQGSPTTYLDISLGELRSVQIFLVGKVEEAGSHFVNAYSTAFTALYQSGGPTTRGSLRDIQVIRNGEVVASLDLYDFITSGKRPNDIRIQNNDVIYVPPRISTVQLKGEVKEKALYEMKKSETLRDLIEYSGGLPTQSGVEKVQIESMKPYAARKKTGEVYEVKTEDLGTYKEDTFQVNPIGLSDQDVVSVFPVTDEDPPEILPGGINYVNVTGHIYKPGRYILGEDMQVSDLISKAGGLKDSVFWKQTYQLRADLIRYTDNGLDRKIISLPLKKLLKKDSMQYDYDLHHRDSLIIYGAGITHKPRQVTIEGEVEEPGDYILQEKMDIHDLLLQAGGFTKRAYQYNVEVFRMGGAENKDQISRVFNVDITPDMLGQFKSEPHITLQDFDMVVVRKDPDFEPHRVVTIEGEIQFEGQYPILRKNETLSELIRRAGGLTDEAFLLGLRFNRDDTTKVVGDFERMLTDDQAGIVLQKGDSIVVPQHPGTVEVSGSVRNPGVVQYHPGWSMDRYVEAAGDYTNDAAKRKTIVYYPGGSARRKRWFFNPDVKEGSEIFVPEKPEREPLDVTQLLTEWASIATSVATVIYIINRN